MLIGIQDGKMWTAIFVVSLFISDIQGCPLVCSCIADTVSCRNRNLNTVPSFDANDFNGVKVLDLSYNNFTSLPSNAFSNAHCEKLLLHHNRIHSIASDSFGASLSKEIQYLDISNNQLTTLPHALGNLSILKSLNVSNNFQGGNVLDLTDSVMKALGDTITEFVFGSLQQEEWPRTLNHLQTLERLEVTGLHPSLTIIPPEGFHGFETTVTEMSIHDTNLLAVPLGISSLRNLKTLNFDYNINTGDQGMLIQSFPTGNGTKLVNLSLKGNSLTVFPSVLKYLNHLVKFTIDDNPLDFLSEESAENLKTLQELSIRNCSLERIPAALSTIANLKAIDLSKNAIETIEQRDLVGFANITSLTLSDMPLKYISRDSLQPLYSMKELIMNNTQLTEVPIAINFTTSLVKVSIGMNHLDCMCENMVWLLVKLSRCSTPSTRPMTVIGDCDTIHSTVEDYLTHYTPNCPGYKEACNIAPYG